MKILVAIELIQRQHVLWNRFLSAWLSACSFGEVLWIINGTKACFNPDRASIEWPFAVLQLHICVFCSGISELGAMVCQSHTDASTTAHGCWLGTYCLSTLNTKKTRAHRLLDTGSLAKWLAQAFSQYHGPFFFFFLASAKMLKVMLESINELYVGETTGDFALGWTLKAVWDSFRSLGNNVLSTWLIIIYWLAE